LGRSTTGGGPLLCKISTRTDSGSARVTQLVTRSLVGKSENWVLIPGRHRDVSLHHHVHIISRDHPVGTGGSFHGVK
jgi:hypothetical protein